MEAGVEKDAGDGVFRYGNAIDRGDEQTGAGAVLCFCVGALDGLDEEFGEGSRGMGAGRLFFREQ